MKLVLIGVLLFVAGIVFAAPLSITDEACPSQLLDIDSGQLVCIDLEPNPDPDPEPEPEPGAICPVQPNLYNAHIVVTGGPFADCGETTTLRSPDPAATYSHITGRGFEGFSLCAMPGSWQQELWRYPSGTVTIENHDMRILIADTVTGDLVFNGSRQRVDLVNGASVHGSVVCGPLASNVQFNGECVCP